jgi:hypothetical protein
MVRAAYGVQPTRVNNLGRQYQLRVQRAGAVVRLNGRVNQES